MWPKKQTFLLILMFLIGFLVPSAWMATLTIASAAQPQEAPLGWCIDNPVPPSNKVTLDAPSIPLTGPITIGDFVWYDLNENGLQDDDEPGVEGVLSTLCKVDEMKPVATTMTDGEGYYSFKLTDTQPIAGDDSYYIVFEIPDDYTFTIPDVGDNQDDHDLIDSDVVVSPYLDYPNAGRSNFFTLMDRVNDTWDAGLIDDYVPTSVELETLTADRGTGNSWLVYLFLGGLVASLVRSRRWQS